MTQNRYENDIDKNIATLSNSYDDDRCTSAAEFLGKAGSAALPKLHRLLTLHEYQATTTCEPSERLYYVAKALAHIGARESLPHLVRHFQELDGVSSNRPTGAMLKLVEVMKTLAPEETADFPRKPGFMMDDQEAALPAFREAVSKLQQSL